MFGYLTRSPVYNLHKWAVVSLHHLAGCDIGKTCIQETGCFEISIAPAFIGLVQMAKRKTFSESGAAALSMMKVLAEKDPEFQSAFASFLTQFDALYQQFTVHSPDFGYESESSISTRGALAEGGISRTSMLV